MIITFLQSLKSKLKDLHTRESKLITQFFHFRSDHTKIFCPDRKILAELFLDSLEQFFARAFFPFTVYSSLFISRYGPVSSKPRKWSRRTTSNSAILLFMRQIHQA